MAGCPTGVLVEVCSTLTPPPTTSTKTLNELLNELGVKYSLASEIRSVKTLPPLKWKASGKQKKKSSSPSISEDDLITNEVFDFKVPSFEDLDLPECDQQTRTFPHESHLAFEFPVLSLDVPPQNSVWNAEVTLEAKKISKRLSMITELALLTPSSETYSGSGSSVHMEDETYTAISSAKSSDNDDNVFSSPFLKKKSTCVKKGKENDSRHACSSPPFVPHPNAAEALTPEGVRKIRGPLLRRGTFTLDTNTPTTKRFVSSGNSVSRMLGQDLAHTTKFQTSTPKSVQRSKSLIRTPEVSAKISTFRKGESPEIAKRRSSSLSRCPSFSEKNTSFTKPLQPAPPKSKVGGPSPLLRKALVPRMHSRPASTLSNSFNTTRGPMKATVTASGRDSQRSFSAKQVSSVTAARSTTQSHGSRILQPRNQLNI